MWWGLRGALPLAAHRVGPVGQGRGLQTLAVWTAMHPEPGPPTSASVHQRHPPSLQYSDRSQTLPAPLSPVTSRPHSQSRWGYLGQGRWFHLHGRTSCSGEIYALAAASLGKERKLVGAASQPHPEPPAPALQGAAPWARYGNSPPYPEQSPTSWGVPRSAPGSPSELHIHSGPKLKCHRPVGSLGFPAAEHEPA